MHQTSLTDERVITAKARERLVSVDALRGFDMFWIVGAGSIVQALDKMNADPEHPHRVTQILATQLKHVEWEGFRFYDLIFPLFLFIVGVSMVFSLGRALTIGSRGAVIWRVFRRSLLLYVLGVFYSGGLTQQWPEVALGGVLQRIACCYLLAAIVYCCVRRPMGIAAVAAALLLNYWALLEFVPFPDLKLDSETVNAIAERINSASPSAIAAEVPERICGEYEEGRNLTNYVDFRWLPGRKAQRFYINEGLLSTLPATALPLFGALAGLLLQSANITPRRKTLYLLAAGAFGIAVALTWSLEMPFIKRIWTSSFVLLTAGISAMLLAVFYEIIDVRQRRAWCQPFVWIGSNAITLYLTAHLVPFSSISQRLVGGDVKQFFDTHVAEGFGSLVIAMVSLLLVILLARFLYKRHLIIRV